MFVTSGAPNPFSMPKYIALDLQFFYDAVFPQLYSGKTPISPTTLLTGTVKGIITWGQSNMTTAGGNARYTTVNVNKAMNLNPYDGGLYEITDPILGCTDAFTSGVSSFHGPFADRLISTHPSWKVILCPIALAGSAYEMWVPNTSTVFASGANFFLRIRTAILRFRALGIEPAHILCGMGESDANFTAKETLKSHIRAIVDEIRALGCTAPCWFGYYTRIGDTLGQNVRDAITECIEGAPRDIRAGFDADTLGGPYRTDGAHFNNTGWTALGNGWADLIEP